MGFDLGSLHVGVPAIVSIVFVGAVIVIIIWGLMSAAFGSPSVDHESRDERYPHRLDRSRSRVLGGVCSGIARYFGWQTGTTRAAFVVLTIFSAGFTMLLVYLVLWRVMPLEPLPQPKEFALAGFRVD